MEILTARAAQKWCEARDILVDNALIPSRQVSLGPDAFRLRIKIPRESLRSVTLAYVLLMTGLMDDDEANFKGGLIWLMDWDIGSGTTERVGLRIMQAIRDGNSSFTEQPAQVFNQSEFVDANAMLSLPALFQWDAFFTPMSGAILAFVSHEGYLEVGCREQLDYRRLASRFRAGNWE